MSDIPASNISTTALRIELSTKLSYLVQRIKTTKMDLSDEKKHLLCYALMRATEVFDQFFNRPEIIHYNIKNKTYQILIHNQSYRLSTNPLTIASSDCSISYNRKTKSLKIDSSLVDFPESILLQDKSLKFIPNALQEMIEITTSKLRPDIKPNDSDGHVRLIHFSWKLFKEIESKLEATIFPEEPITDENIDTYNAHSKDFLKEALITVFTTLIHAADGKYLFHYNTNVYPEYQVAQKNIILKSDHQLILYHPARKPQDLSIHISDDGINISTSGYQFFINKPEMMILYRNQCYTYQKEYAQTIVDKFAMYIERYFFQQLDYLEGNNITQRARSEEVRASSRAYYLNLRKENEIVEPADTSSLKPVLDLPEGSIAEISDIPLK